ncbi:hypothetical protein M0638_23730 [Roseomonas sp. NAR14]|uniref:Uncharacterized protein n=1 Tax=Roseomonas acroporae TaxID=2937791 RepID=A0A9X1YE60_9PROT|nr:hypothetical protein [Roseomonas acroporae]MCK8787385.1 hypothetical protein [Roseomonas acroporae]
MLTAKERELLRRELGMRFGQYPSLAEGLFLRNWRGGPRQGQPKLPPAVQSMLARGLVEIGPGRIGYRACFTAAGLTALRQFLQGRHALEPGLLAHLRQELGVDGVTPRSCGGVPRAPASA